MMKYFFLEKKEHKSFILPFSLTYDLKNQGAKKYCVNSIILLETPKRALKSSN